MNARPADLIFLAHAPSAAVMNMLTTGYLTNTNTVIHCSKYDKRNGFSVLVK